MLPSILARQLQTGIEDYIEATFPMTNGPFRGSLKKFINTNDTIYHEPYFTVRMPIEEVKQISDDEVELTYEDGKVRVIKIKL